MLPASIYRKKGCSNAYFQPTKRKNTKSELFDGFVKVVDWLALRLLIFLLEKFDL